MAAVKVAETITSINSGPAKGGLRQRYMATNALSQILRPVPKDDAADDEIFADLKGPERPVIGFMPDRANFERRVASLQATREKGQPVNKLRLEKLPAQITGPRLWTPANQNVQLEHFVIQLSPEDVREIEHALRYFQELPGPNGPDQMSKHLFPLPNLGQRLKRLTDELHNGSGLVILRGLDASKYSDVDTVLLYLGVSSHIGQKVGCQDRKGTLITHITSRGKRDETSPAYTTAGLPFHTDVCDILALYVRDQAASGGEISFASSAAVYNEIAESRPDILNLLASDVWCYDSRLPLLPDWPRRPLLHRSSSHGPFFLFSRRKLLGSSDLSLSPHIPVMTEFQAEALDFLHFTAEKHSLTFRLRPGDVLFANNLALMHARGEYIELAQSEHKRHLLRLWLRNEELAWETPEALRQDWFDVYGDESERRARAFWTIGADDLDMGQFLSPATTCPT